MSIAPIMTQGELIELIESMTNDELDRLNNALRAVKVEIPKPPSPPHGAVVFDCRPPNGDYLAPDLTERLKRAAGKAGVTITIIHAGSPSGWDFNHAPGDIDILYQDTPEATARMLLAIAEEFPAITRSTLPNPTPRQKLSAATSGLDTGNHDTHVHVPLTGGQMILSPERRAEVLDAAGRM
jgi:hypothetical protein